MNAIIKTMKKILLLAFFTNCLFAGPLIDYVKTEEQIKKESETPGYKKEKYLEEFTQPWEDGNPDEKIEFRFENASLATFIDYFAERFNLTFLLDDALNPAPTGAGKVEGNKITFSTHKPFSKKEAWGIFTSFLDLAGLTVVPGPEPRVYKIAPVKNDSPLSPGKNPLPLFINTRLEELPNDDSFIRYIVFIENTSMDTIAQVIDQLKSVNSPRIIGIPDMRAFVLTDKSSNIKNMLAIIRELDQPSQTETMRILKLEHGDATKAVALYKELAKVEEPSLTARLLGQRKKPNIHYFPENVRLTAYPPANKIVIIGTKDSVDRVYEFLQKMIDKSTDTQHKPFFTYELKYRNAVDTARIINDAVKFMDQSEAAKSGGVRDGDKFFRGAYVQAEQASNNLVIFAEYEDYTKIVALIKKIDVEEPQVAIKILLLNIDLSENKELGTQLRNKVPGVNGLLGNNVNFQTSGLVNTSVPNGTASPIIENPNGTGATRLLGDLVNLAQLTSAGSTLLTLGSDIYGVWGVFSLLEQYTKTSVVSNPFIVTTNKYPSTISVGTIRRVLDSQIQNSGNTVGAYKDMSANLTINVTPQISSKDGLISMDVLVNYEQFTGPDNQNLVASGNRTRKAVNTSVVMANNEVLALGGMIQDTVQDTVTKVPILGDIPILGNLFKNTIKQTSRTSLLVLIMPEVISSTSDAIADRITEDKILDTKAVFYGEAKQRDPFLRWFFKDQVPHGETIIDEFVDLKNKYIDESQYARIEKPERLKKIVPQSLMDHMEESKEIAAKKEHATHAIEPSSKIMKMVEARYGSINKKPKQDQETAA